MFAHNLYDISKSISQVILACIKAYKRFAEIIKCSHQIMKQPPSFMFLLSQSLLYHAIVLLMTLQRCVKNPIALFTVLMALRAAQCDAKINF